MLTEKELTEADNSNAWIDTDEVVTTFRSLRLALAKSYEEGYKDGLDDGGTGCCCEHHS